MPIFPKFRLPAVTAVCLIILLGFNDAEAEMDPRFKLDPQALPAVKSVPASGKTAKKRYSPPPSEQPPADAGQGVVYTVKPGDQMYKVLKRDFGLTTNEAWQLMKEICRVNSVADLDFIKAGTKILIPPFARGSESGSPSVDAAYATSANTGTPAVMRQTFKLQSPSPDVSGQEAVVGVNAMWNRLVPSSQLIQKPVTVQTPAFSLTLEPSRYPMFPRMDGGRIVLDPNGTIPSIVKDLVKTKDSSVRILSDEPPGSRLFMKSMLNAAGFYSVEENFKVDFGVDPKLTMQFDFKVEKTAESLVSQDVDLVNSGRTFLAPALGEILKNQGFTLHEPFAMRKPFVQRNYPAIYSVTSKKPTDILDFILSACAVSPERKRSLDLFSPADSGFSLSVNPDYYFERGGQRYVVTGFDGDPILYTLFRILETKGYNVVFLDASDDFRAISEKLIPRMKVKGLFAQHNLITDEDAGFSLQMSGYKLDDTVLPNGSAFLTDRTIDPVIRNLFLEQGFTINTR